MKLATNTRCLKIDNVGQTASKELKPTPEDIPVVREAPGHADKTEKLNTFLKLAPDKTEWSPLCPRQRTRNYFDRILSELQSQFRRDGEEKNTCTR